VRPLGDESHENPDTLFIQSISTNSGQGWDIKQQLISNIVLAGGSTKFQGFEDR
jgi:actin-related protein